MMLNSIFFLTGSKKDFINHFPGDALQTQAQRVWQELMSYEWSLLFMALAIGGIGAFIYYGPYNNQPGRHYKIKYWGLLGFITIVINFLLTWFIEWIGIHPYLGSRILGTYLMGALSNTIYCAGAYVLVSFIYCNWLNTNAYRFLKI